MHRCSGIKPNGGRCERIVSQEQSYCYSHDPARQAERKRNAARGGKAKASGELAWVKADLADLVAATREGSIEKGVAAVIAQIWNVYLRAVSVGLDVQERLELVREIEEMREILENQKERSWAG